MWYWCLSEDGKNKIAASFYTLNSTKNQRVLEQFGLEVVRMKLKKVFFVKKLGVSNKNK